MTYEFDDDRQKINDILTYFSLERKFDHAFFSEVVKPYFGERIIFVYF